MESSPPRPPGNRWVQAPGPAVASNTGPCPAEADDGACVALTLEGLLSSPIPTKTLPVVAYNADDLLGGTSDKVRLLKPFVVDVVDLAVLAYEGRLAGTDLHSVDLRGIDFHQVDLHETDLQDAQLERADIHAGLDLRGTCLFGTYLTGAQLKWARYAGSRTDDDSSHGNLPRWMQPAS